MNYCRFCGSPLKEGALFCSKCGAAVRAGTPPAAQDAGPAPVHAPVEQIPVPQAPEPSPLRVEEPIQTIPTPAPAAPQTPPQVEEPVESIPTPAPAGQGAAPAKKAVPKWVLVVVIAAAAFAVFWFFIRKDPVQDVKDFVFYDYGAIPFGTVVDSVMPGTTWSSTGGGSTYMVTMSGMYDFVPSSATFQVTYSGSVPYVRFLSTSVMGETVSDPEDFVPALYDIYSYNAGNAGTGIGW